MPPRCLLPVSQSRRGARWGQMFGMNRSTGFKPRPLLRGGIKSMCLVDAVFQRATTDGRAVNWAHDGTHNVILTLNSSVECYMWHRSQRAWMLSSKDQARIRFPTRSRAHAYTGKRVCTHTLTHTLSLTHAVRHGMEEAAAVPRLSHNFG